jgi:hypothetical protein
MGGEPGRAEDRSEVARLAAALKPGEWAELKSRGYDPDSLMRGDDILAYAGRAAWDPVSRQVLFIGQVHLKGPPVFIAYSVADNAWRRLPTPGWAESLKWFHAYENNTADGRGGFYHHASASRAVHKYDVAGNKWSAVPDLDAPTGHGTALEYFPEMKGLVRVLGGEAWGWTEGKSGWTRLAKGLDLGPYHNFAAYSPRAKVVLLGGGNDSRSIYRLDETGKVTAGKPAPVDLGTGRSLNVADPVSGDLLVLAKGGKLFAYTPAKDQWRELPTAGLSFPKYAGHSVSAAPLTGLGVVLYFSSRPQGMKTYVYKHARE